MLATAICGALAMPVLTALLPRWYVPLGTLQAVQVRPAGSIDAVDVTTEFHIAPHGTAASATAPVEQTAPPIDAVRLLTMLWLSGIACVAIALVAGLFRLRSIARSSIRIQDGVWANRLADMAATEPTLKRVVLLESPHPSLLMTWGIRHPRIVIPGCAREWDDARVSVVLEHEAEHIRRGDWLMQLAAQALCAFAWFNPLAWLAAARLQLESERACDDAVLQNGVDASDYAEHLVHMARILARPRVWIPAPAMARSSSLERRVTAMLDTGLVRHPVSRVVRRVVVALGLAATASIASFAAQSQFATMSGTLRDQLGGTIPGGTLKLTNADSRASYEIKADRAGHFEFVGLVPGNYEFEVWQAGFKNVHDTLQLAAGQTATRNLTLEVGTLEETVTVVDAPASGGDSAPRRAAAPPPMKPCSSDPNSGAIVPPRKLDNTRPRYPEALRGSGRSGRVVLWATIGTDGVIHQIQTVEATSPEFEDSATEAVRQWRFTQTLLNCVPIEVQMRVTTAFDSNGSAQIVQPARRLGDAAIPAPPPPPNAR
jgi:TonB family protein